jgi:hypothetical protein
MGDQALSVSSLEEESQQEMLLQALAELGLDPDLALEAAMEPVWMAAGPNVPDTNEHLPDTTEQMATVPAASLHRPGEIDPPPTSC